MQIQGKILWWSRVKQHGIISANIDGRNQRFYLHISRIVSGPEILKPEQVVWFTPSEKPHKPDQLPVALHVTVSDESETVAPQSANIEVQS